MQRPVRHSKRKLVIKGLIKRKLKLCIEDIRSMPSTSILFNSLQQGWCKGQLVLIRSSEARKEACTPALGVCYAPTLPGYRSRYAQSTLLPMAPKNSSSSFFIADQSDRHSVSSFCSRIMGRLPHFQACGQLGGGSEALSPRLASTIIPLGTTFPGRHGRVCYRPYRKARQVRS